MVSVVSSWEIHRKWAERLNVPPDVARSIDERIDSLHDMRYHDLGRVIVSGYWLFEVLYPFLLDYYEEFGVSGVKGFLLHHVLDYMNTLLYSPSVDIVRVLELCDRLLNRIKSDAMNIKDERLKALIINTCDRIKEFIRDEELLQDIKPEEFKWLSWAKARLIKLRCKRCGKPFTTIDKEAREHLAKMGVGIPQRFLEFCLKCREIGPLSVWIESERERAIELLGWTSRFHRAYYHYLGDSIGVQLDELWAENTGKVAALILVLRAIELEEASSK